MSSLPKSYDPKLVEQKWYSFWEENGFFKVDPHSKKHPYGIVMPPPNVTGRLHMGHALVGTVQDLLIRWKRMQGFEVLWVPGTDHAGIATQTVVEKDLFAKTKKRRKDFSQEEFLAHVWKWKEGSEAHILGQLKKLGCSCDWSRTRFTMDAGCNRAVRTCFAKMYRDGLIYRGDYLVNWDPVTQTALSDDEVEHEERSSFLWHIRYPLSQGKGSIVIATTRPETLLGDSAIAVHPKDERYQKWIGQKIRLPLVGREIPIIADGFVDPTFGSGAVKVTPAHDFTDFEVGNRHGLARINVMTKDGKINEEGGEFAGLDIEEARHKIVDKLQKLGLIEKIEPHVLRVGLSYRSKAVLQPFLSKQWFVKMSHFKPTLLSAVREKRVKVIPEHWEATYTHWIENLRDWCISRQIWWGHRIPIWYNKDNPDEILCFDGEGLPPEVEKNPEQWIHETDVLDTWFSSALWPLSVLGWPDRTELLKKFYPTSTLITGHDILFFWVARMILMGEYITGEVPFHETFLHGLIYGKSYWRELANGTVSYLSAEEKKKYDLGAPLPKEVQSKWEKMSKTKGNVVDPLEIIEDYGTDAMRIALCSSVTHARQIDLDPRKFEEFKNFANKVWNGARFVLMNIEDLSSAEVSHGLDLSLLALEDRWILSVLNRTIREVNHDFTSYTFDKAAMRAYEFFWNDFCAVYVEISKPILFGKMGNVEARKNKQKLLLILLMSALRLLHPITPFITEELFQILHAQFTGCVGKNRDHYTRELVQALASPACIKAPYPAPLDESDLALEDDFAKLLEIVRAIRNIRTEIQIPPSEKTELVFFGPQESRERRLLEMHQGIVLSLTPTSQVVVGVSEPTSFGASALVGELKLFIPIPASLKEREKARLEKERDRLLGMEESTKAKLSNPDFVARAPTEIVQKLEGALSQTKQQLAEVLEKLVLM